MTFRSKSAAWIAIPACMLLLGGCDKSSRPAEKADTGSTADPQRANPASEHCTEVGGKHTIESRPDGAQFGVCLFDDNRQCEEWALLRGECPAGGIRVTGYITPAARYCAITGGRYAVLANSGSADEQGSCALGNNVSCDASAYFEGSCAPPDP